MCCWRQLLKMDLNIKFWFYIASLLLAFFRRGSCVYSNTPSCSNTIAYVRLHEPDLLYTHDPEVVSLCGLGSQSCCRTKVEKRFLIRSKQNVTIDIEKKLNNLLQEYKSYDTLTAAYAHIIEKGREHFTDYFSSTFGIHHHKYTQSADRLFQYLSNFTSTLDASRLAREFYDLHVNLFVTFSKKYLDPTHVSPGSEQCIRSVYRRFHHYTGYNTLYTSLRNILQKLRLVLRVRETLHQILEHWVRDQSLLSGDDCSESLMRMSICRVCGGYSLHSLSPCKNLCLNTMGSCLAPVRRLTSPLRYQYRMLNQLIHQSSEEFKGFEDQLTNIAETTLDFIIRLHNNSKIIRRVKNQCLRENTNRRRRSPSSVKDWNISLTLHSYPKSDSAPLPSLNTGLKHILVSHDRVVSFLRRLPDELCHMLGAASGNSHCWNGKEKGRYREKLLYKTTSQQLAVSHTPNFLPYQFYYERIKQATYALQDFVKVKACYIDDLQCLASLPKCSWTDYELGSGISGDGHISSAGENEMGGEDVSSLEDESFSYSGDNYYESKARSSKNGMFYRIAWGMSDTVKTCLPEQFDSPIIYTKPRISPVTNPAYINFNITEYDSTPDTSHSNTTGNAGVKNCCFLFLVGVCLCALMLL